MSGRPLRRAREAQMLANGNIVPIEHEKIQRFVDDVLTVKLKVFFAGMPAANVPIGVWRSIVTGTLRHTDPKNGGTLDIKVTVQALPTTGPGRDLVDGAVFYPHSNRIKVNLNPQKREWDFAENNYANLRTQLFEILAHEVTHFYDCRFPHPHKEYHVRDESGKVILDEYGRATVGDFYAKDADGNVMRDEGGAPIVASRHRYYSEPSEVRAYTQTIVAQAVRNAKVQSLRDYASSDESQSPNLSLVYVCLARSPDWHSHGLNMNERNQRLVFDTVYREFARQGLLFK